VESPPVNGRSVATVIVPEHEDRLPPPPLLDVVLFDVPQAARAAIPTTPTRGSNRLGKDM
jgi:hypothetical protein